MKTIALEQLSAETSKLLTAAQHERILVTRNGQPLAMVVGVEFKDAEDLALEASPEFWRMIEQRRAEPAVPLKDIKDELLAEP